MENFIKSRAFWRASHCLVHALVLFFPEYSLNIMPFILDTDASIIGIGLVLSQVTVHDGIEHIIAYGS